MTGPGPVGSTVLLADPHRIVREGLRRLLDEDGDMSVSAEAATGHQVLEQLRRHPVDVALVELNLPGLGGLDLIRRLRAEWPALGVLVLTVHAEEQYALRAFRAGAQGYLSKDCAPEELLGALRKVAGGGAYLSPALAERLAVELTGLHEAPAHTLLSDREFEVFRMIVAGLRLTEIAERLHLSVKTVSTHKSRILEKMKLDSTAALVRYGVQHGLFVEDTEPRR
ncbi:response regulator transcription factor [Caldimonas tepidiphila]|uniref:response regulator n=1 Tax=Caldimonas tepidiphila TaxID=2315841 RepID=UPI000E5B80EE|nr:response regulator transcription factor [Caldimonas tepidiphila]